MGLCASVPYDQAPRRLSSSEKKRKMVLFPFFPVGLLIPAWVLLRPVVGTYHSCERAGANVYMEVTLQKDGFYLMHRWEVTSAEQQRARDGQYSTWKGYWGCADLASGRGTPGMPVLGKLKMKAFGDATVLAPPPAPLRLAAVTITLPPPTSAAAPASATPAAPAPGVPAASSSSTSSIAPAPAPAATSAISVEVSPAPTAAPAASSPAPAATTVTITLSPPAALLPPPAAAPTLLPPPALVPASLPPPTATDPASTTLPAAAASTSPAPSLSPSPLPAPSASPAPASPQPTQLEQKLPSASPLLPPASASSSSASPAPTATLPSNSASAAPTPAPAAASPPPAPGAGGARSGRWTEATSGVEDEYGVTRDETGRSWRLVQCYSNPYDLRAGLDAEFWTAGALPDQPVRYKPSPCMNDCHFAFPYPLSSAPPTSWLYVSSQLHFVFCVLQIGRSVNHRSASIKRISDFCS
jgi:hypothetical protein